MLAAISAPLSAQPAAEQSDQTEQRRAVPPSSKAIAPLIVQQRPFEAQAEDPPSIKRFHKDLIRNAAALWSQDNLGPLVIGAGLATTAKRIDEPARNYFQRNRWGQYSGIGRFGGSSQVVGPAVGAAFLIGRMTKDVKFQRFSYDLAQGFLITNGVTAGIKEIAGRTRPDGSDNLSFLSGHTSNSFLWATVASRHYGWKAGLPAYAFATYVGTSRLRSHKHFVTDVAAGAALGYIIGRTVTRSPKERRRVRWGVMVPPGGGAAVSIGIRPPGRGAFGNR